MTKMVSGMTIEEEGEMIRKGKESLITSKEKEVESK